jgi:hypothetical protein
MATPHANTPAPRANTRLKPACWRLTALCLPVATRRGAPVRSGRGRRGEPVEGQPASLPEKVTLGRHLSLRGAGAPGVVQFTATDSFWSGGKVSGAIEW